MWKLKRDANFVFTLQLCVWLKSSATTHLFGRHKLTTRWGNNITGKQFADSICTCKTVFIVDLLRSCWMFFYYSVSKNEVDRDLWFKNTNSNWQSKPKWSTHVLKKAVSPAYKSGEKKERNKLIISKGRYACFTESTRVCSKGMVYGGKGNKNR